MQDLTKWQRGDHIGRIGTSTPGTSYGTTLKVETTQVLNQAPGVNCLKFMEFQVGFNWSGRGNLPASTGMAASRQLPEL